MYFLYFPFLNTIYDLLIAILSRDLTAFDITSRLLLLRSIFEYVRPREITVCAQRSSANVIHVTVIFGGLNDILCAGVSAFYRVLDTIYVNADDEVTCAFYGNVNSKSRKIITDRLVA